MSRHPDRGRCNTKAGQYFRHRKCETMMMLHLLLFRVADCAFFFFFADFSMIHTPEAHKSEYPAFFPLPICPLLFAFDGRVRQMGMMFTYLFRSCRRVFVTNLDGSEYVGQVWPGFTASFEPATGNPAKSSDPAMSLFRCSLIGSRHKPSSGG